MGWIRPAESNLRKLSPGTIVIAPALCFHTRTEIRNVSPSDSHATRRTSVGVPGRAGAGVVLSRPWESSFGGHPRRLRYSSAIDLGPVEEMVIV